MLIGIDTYPHVGPLAGCVNDCDAVKAWLERSFDDVHLVILTNDQATRAKILTALGNLAKDQDIQENDPILIFYSGHGAEVKPLEEWKLPSKRKIQMLIPYDFKYTSGYFVLSAPCYCHTSIFFPKRTNTINLKQGFWTEICLEKSPKWQKRKAKTL